MPMIVSARSSVPPAQSIMRQRLTARLARCSGSFTVSRGVASCRCGELG